VAQVLVKWLKEDKSIHYTFNIGFKTQPSTREWCYWKKKA